LTADLGVTKSSSVSDVDTQASFSYQVTVSNAYSDTASSIVLTDTLPSGINYTGYSGPGTCSEMVVDKVIVCTLAELAVGDTANFTFDVIAPTVDYTRFITNSVSVSAPAYDPNGSNNSATAITRVLAVADLAVDKADSADPVDAKENLVYGVAVRNDGPSVATGVVLTDKLPAGMGYVSSTGCASVYFDSVTREIHCELDDITAGTFVNVNFLVTAPANGGIVVNSANVTSNEDPDLSNNSDTEDTMILGHSKLVLQKWSNDPVYRDEPFEYHVTVTNEGPSDAQNVTVTDRLPSGVEYLDSYNPYDSTPPDPGNPNRCLLSGNNVICELETIPNGTVRHITITVIPRVAGEIDNLAVVDSTTRLTGDNEATSTADVLVKVGLSLAKTSTPDATFVGDPITYTVKATNSGPSDATDVIIRDRLPDGVQYKGRRVTNGWSCDVSGLPEITCSPDDADRTMIAGSEVEIIIYAAAAAEGTQTNSARLSAAEISSDLSASTDTKVNPPLAPFDLSLGITAPLSVTAGSAYTYYLTVSNAGGYVAPDVVLTSTIPVSGTMNGSVQVTDADNSWTCSVVAGASQNDPDVVRCTATSMAPKSGAEFAISIVAPGVPAILTNEGEVTSSEPPVDSNPANNAQFADTTVE